MPEPTFQLAQRIRERASRDGTRPAYVDAQTGSTLSYAEIFRYSRSLAVGLLRDLPAGATVLLQSANTLAFPVWFVAIISCGMNCLPVHPEATEAELRELVRRANVSAFVGCDEAADLLADVVPSRMPLGRCRVDSAADLTAAELVAPGSLLLTSSGTTGLPKIVRRSAASLDAVADAMVAALGFRPDDVVLASVPLSHSYGVEHGLLAPLWGGSTVHLCDGFNIEVIARELAEHATVFPAVPAVIEMLATLTDVPPAMRKLRLAYSAGGILPAAVHQRFAERFGARVGQVYGMTEIGSVTFSNPLSVDFTAASVGKPMQGVSIRILDVDSNGEGEVAIRSPFMLQEYLGEPAPLIDGHFRTGDIGRSDARGELRITGRVRLLIEVGGRKVNPLEVEAVLSSHPDIGECVVVALKQTDTIHRLRAVLVARDPDHPPTAEAIRQFARERLAGYKVPRVIEFRRSLPRSATGKLLRHQVETEA
jgi:acyl-CoA synthetase (AMP-forming)/AMP-acid ligase II